MKTLLIFLLFSSYAFAQTDSSHWFSDSQIQAVEKLAADAATYKNAYGVEHNLRLLDSISYTHAFSLMQKSNENLTEALKLEQSMPKTQIVAGWNWLQITGISVLTFIIGIGTGIIYEHNK